jgi:hypothetical protein
MTEREKAEGYLVKQFTNPDLVADTYDRQETEMWFGIWQFPRTLTDKQWQIVRDWCNSEEYKVLSDLHAEMYYLAERLDRVEADLEYIRENKTTSKEYK